MSSDQLSTRSARGIARRCVLLFAACTSLRAQTEPAARQNQVPLFRSDARVVVEDVAVTDRQGHPVRSLTKSDFVLSEDGKLQKLSFFEAHVGLAAQQQPQLKLPAHEYTNFGGSPAGSSVNILLFDFLNTPIADQMYARRQMMKFVQALPAGKPVALFTMGRHLRMLTGFTMDPHELMAAAEQVSPQISAVDEDQLAVQMTTAPDYRSPVYAMETRQANSSHAATSLESAMQDFHRGGIAGAVDPSRFVFDVDMLRTENRVESTLAFFDQLARAMAGYPGRKNLIWLSEAFPISSAPGGMEPASFLNVHNYGALLRDRSALLSSSQISVYPIDIRGVANIDPLVAESAYLSMDEIAKETGGKAFYGTNDVGEAIERSIDRGSTYYSLAYVPYNHNWNSRYRRISIKLRQPGLKAEYRPGYVAFREANRLTEDDDTRLIAAMHPAVPDSDRILMRVKVLPPDGANKNVRIDYAVLPSSVSFTDDDHKKRAKLEFMASAWGKDKAAANTSQTVELSLPPESYSEIVKHGVPAHIEMTVAPGDYILRVGVLDYGSGRIGTLNVPLSIPATIRAEH